MTVEYKAGGGDIVAETSGGNPASMIAGVVFVPRVANSILFLCAKQKDSPLAPTDLDKELAQARDTASQCTYVPIPSLYLPKDSKPYPR